MKLSSLLFSVPKLFTFNLTWEVKIHKHSKASLESLIFHWQGFQNSRSLSSNFQTLTIGTMVEHHFETSVHISPLCPHTYQPTVSLSVHYSMTANTSHWFPIAFGRPACSTKQHCLQTSHFLHWTTFHLYLFIFSSKKHGQRLCHETLDLVTDSFW